MCSGRLVPAPRGVVAWPVAKRRPRWGDPKSGVDLCVNLNGGFDYTWDGAGAARVRQGETGVPFMKIDVAAERQHLRYER